MAVQFTWIAELALAAWTLVPERGLLLGWRGECMLVADMVMERTVMCEGVPTLGTYVRLLPQMAVHMLV